MTPEIQTLGFFQTTSLVPLNYSAGPCCSQVPPSCTSNNTVLSLLQTMNRNTSNRLRFIFAITSLPGSELLTDFLTVQAVFHPPNICLIRATSSSLVYENVTHNSAISFSPVHQQKQFLPDISTLPDHHRILFLLLEGLFLGTVSSFMLSSCSAPSPTPFPMTTSAAQLCPFSFSTCEKGNIQVVTCSGFAAHGPHVLTSQRFLQEGAW